MKTKKTNYIIVALVVVLLLLAVGYAAFSQTLNITGTATAKGSWNVHFASPKVDGETNAEVASLSSDNLTLTVDVTLTKPGESKEITVDIVNEGSIAAKLDQFTVKTGATSASTDITAAGGVYEEGNIKMTLTPLAENTEVAAKSGDTAGSVTYTMSFEWPDDGSEITEATEIDQTAHFEITMKFKQK